MRALLTIIVFLVAPLAQAFYSNTGVEVRAEFNHQMYLSGAEPSSAEAQWEAQRLMYYLAGPLQTKEPLAGPKFDGQVRVSEVAHDLTSPATPWRVSFTYTGTFIVQKDQVQDLRLYLPRDYRTIYQASQVGSRNPCTDQHYPEERYFWYFWSPFRQGCRLKEGVHYDVVEPAQITVLEDTGGMTIPEFSRMVDRDGEIKILVIFGADKDELGQRPPANNKDYNANNYLEVRKALLDGGFARRRVSNSEIGQQCQLSIETSQTVEEFTRQDANARLRVRMLWGTTSEGEHSLPYYCLLSHALASGSVIIYNGHSGMGASAYLPQLRERFGLPFALNPDRYQLMAYNGCSSYGYYNSDFFKEKAQAGDPAGSRNLDIITNGIAGNFYDLGRMTISILQSITDWSQRGEVTSYRTIIGRMRTPYLTAINGDEDNPRVR